MATSTCEHATYHRAFEKHKAKEESLNGFDLQSSKSHCAIWGNIDRCDGALCQYDNECSSGCCGSFVAFTHDRCLPIVGDFCAGRDQTRHSIFDYQNDLESQLPSKRDLQSLISDEIEDEEDQLQREALAK